MLGKLRAVALSVRSVKLTYCALYDALEWREPSCLVMKPVNLERMADGGYSRVTEVGECPVRCTASLIVTVDPRSSRVMVVPLSRLLP